MGLLSGVNWIFIFFINIISGENQRLMTYICKEGNLFNLVDLFGIDILNSCGSNGSRNFIQLNWSLIVEPYLKYSKFW